MEDGGGVEAAQCILAFGHRIDGRETKRRRARQRRLGRWLAFGKRRTRRARETTPPLSFHQQQCSLDICMMMQQHMLCGLCVFLLLSNKSCARPQPRAQNAARRRVFVCKKRVLSFSLSLHLVRCPRPGDVAARRRRRFWVPTAQSANRARSLFGTATAHNDALLCGLATCQPIMQDLAREIVEMAEEEDRTFYVLQGDCATEALSRRALEVRLRAPSGGGGGGSARRLRIALFVPAPDAACIYGDDGDDDERRCARSELAVSCVADRAGVRGAVELLVEAGALQQWLDHEGATTRDGGGRRLCAKLIALCVGSSRLHQRAASPGAPHINNPPQPRARSSSSPTPWPSRRSTAATICRGAPGGTASASAASPAKATTTPRRTAAAWRAR